MKHVLFIQPELSGVGGIQQVLPQTFKGLAEKEMLVSSLSFYGEAYVSNQLNYSLSLEEEIQHGFLKRLISRVKRVREIIKTVKKCNPNIIVVSTHNTASLVIVLKLLRLVRVPVIHYVHQSILTNDRKGLTSFLQRYFSGFIVVSKGLAAEIESTLKGLSRPIVIAYNGVPVASKCTTRPSTPHFVTASRIEFIKGVDVLTELMTRYFKSNPGTISIYGEGSLSQDLINKVYQNGMSDRILFCGRTTDVFSKLLNTTAYISCARSEAFGVSLVESLSCAVPVVCTDVPSGPREVLDVSNNSLQYPFETEFGVMFADAPESVPEALEKWIDSNYVNFEKSMQFVINNKFSQESIKARASYFSISNQVNQVEKAIIKTLEQYE